jgi:Tol biopolymer transport system component
MSSSGALYYISPGLGGTNIYSAELSEGIKVTQAPVRATDRFVNASASQSVSPDGHYMAYFSLTGSTRGLRIRTLATGEDRDVPVQLAMYALFGAGPEWFPDGRSVLVIAREPQRPGFSYHRVDLSNGKAERLVGLSPIRPTSSKLSPDGKAIYYTEIHTDDAGTNVTRLVRFDIESRRETELRTGIYMTSLAVSPDSKQLALVAGEDLVVMSADGGAPREVFRGGPWKDSSRYGTVAWTPDQRFLLFVKGSLEGKSPNVLWRVPAAGGPPEQVGISMKGQIKAPQIHPDGRRIYFTVNEPAPGELWALENFLSRPAAAK